MFNSPDMTRSERLALLTSEQIAMLVNVADHIEAEPESWYQSTFRGRRRPDGAPISTYAFDAADTCNTTFCIAGWAIQLAGLWDEMDQSTDDTAIEHVAEDLLGLDHRESEFMFYDGYQHEAIVGAHKEVADWLRDIAAGADVVDSAPEWWSGE